MSGFWTGLYKLLNFRFPYSYQVGVQVGMQELGIEFENIDLDRFYSCKLCKDYIYNFPKLESFYQYDFRRIESYFRRACDVYEGYDHILRTKISSILEKYNREHCCQAETLNNIDSFKDEKSLVVIGGQQPGLLTNPLFIIYKILTVLKLSKFLEDKLKVKVIPCFWNASDDDNLTSIASVRILNQNVKEIILDLANVKEGTRYSNILLSPSSFEKVIEGLKSILYSTEYKDKIINFLYKCLNSVFLDANNHESSFIASSITPSSFFSIIILKMFSKYGLVVIDPVVREFKELSYHLLELDIENHSKIKDIIHFQGQKLKEVGYHAQLNLESATLNFFLTFDGIREKITEYENGIFEVGNYKGYKIKKDELLNLVKNDIGKVSLNVVLRPLFQDSVLPVVANVCGPGEVSYFAQIKKVYDLLSIKLPIIYPRFSATIVEKKVKKVLDKLNISYSELEMDREELLQKVLKKNLSLDLDSLLSNFESEIHSKLRTLEREISNTGIDTGSSFDRIKRNIGKEIDVLKRKLFSEYKKQNDYIRQSIDKIVLNIFPNQNLQEREICIWSYINKYGFELVDEIYKKIEPLSFSHKLIKIV